VPAVIIATLIIVLYNISNLVFSPLAHAISVIMGVQGQIGDHPGNHTNRSDLGMVDYARDGLLSVHSLGRSRSKPNRQGQIMFLTLGFEATHYDVSASCT
jgi:hypothetical protein